MQLNFTTHINKIPNYFVVKILNSLYDNKIINYSQTFDSAKKYYSLIDNKEPLIFGLKPKIHTIRQDKKKRFKPGVNLQLVIFPYQKGKRLQFAPTIVCTSTQKIIIKYFYNGKTEQFDLPTVLIDGKEIKGKQLLALANNDGFDTVEDFFAYFKTDFTGKIIHWTNFKY